MGRLDDIVARNRRGRRPREKTLVMAAIGVFLLIVLGLLVFTDLGTPPHASAPAPDHHQVDGVLLRSVPGARTR